MTMRKTKEARGPYEMINPIMVCRSKSTCLGVILSDCSSASATSLSANFPGSWFLLYPACSCMLSHVNLCLIYPFPSPHETLDSFLAVFFSSVAFSVLYRWSTLFFNLTIHRSIWTSAKLLTSLTSVAIYFGNINIRNNRIYLALWHHWSDTILLHSLFNAITV